ncbi:hypothetical protein B0H10DRAFT_1948510 [Mycena sp. CBHHK59/15]|nr:hypothetical protein B0H10DRAFT_1948510 [Mycena sp. CBHHK59/15]
MQERAVFSGPRVTRARGRGGTSGAGRGATRGMRGVTRGTQGAIRGRGRGGGASADSNGESASDDNSDGEGEPSPAPSPEPSSDDSSSSDDSVSSRGPSPHGSPTPSNRADEDEDGSDSDGEEIEVVRLNGHRWVRGNLEFMVMWSEGDATWELLSTVNDCQEMDTYLAHRNAADPVHLPKHKYLIDKAVYTWPLQLLGKREEARGSGEMGGTPNQTNVPTPAQAQMIPRMYAFIIEPYFEVQVHRFPSSMRKTLKVPRISSKNKVKSRYQPLDMPI